jgi:hypothetical protein
MTGQPVAERDFGSIRARPALECAQNPICLDSLLPEAHIEPSFHLAAHESTTKHTMIAKHPASNTHEGLTMPPRMPTARMA